MSSEVRPKTQKGRSLEATERLEASGHTEEIDADRASSLLDNLQYHSFQRGLACQDARHWHGPACRLPDCRLGWLEGKLGSSCGRPWSNTVEEPPRRSRSLDLAFKNHQSVAMLPYLLSNLAVCRTRSEPCIFGKDFLRITLPLPGESNACEASTSSTGQSEEDIPPYVAKPSTPGLEAQEGMVVIMHTTPEPQGCDETTISETDTSLRSRWLRDDGAPFDESAQSASVNEFNMQASHTSLQKASENSNESHSLEIGQACRVSDASFCEKAGIGSPVVAPPASRTPHWDDWWTCQPEELSAAKLYLDSHRVQRRRNNSSDESWNPASPNEVDEDVFDEGYLVLDEKGDEQLECGSEGEADRNSDDEVSSENLCLDARDHAKEDLPTTTHFNNSKMYQEDDIWSDEQSGSLGIKVFPPPISILANETHPGLPSHVPKPLWRSMKKDGRFVLQEVQAQPREFFQATREYGRLRLQLVRPDSDSTGSYTETASLEDKEGSSPSSEGEGTSTGVTDTCQPEGASIQTSGVGTSYLESSSQGFLTYQVEDETPGGEGNDKDKKPFWDLKASALLPDEQSSPHREEHSGAECGQMVHVEVLGTADAVLKECVDLKDSEIVLEATSGVEYRGAIEGTPRDDEGFGRTSSLMMMPREMKEIDICNGTDGMPATVHGSEEQYRQDYQQPCFSATYGFDNNLSVLSPSQAFMQFPIQPAVR